MNSSVNRPTALDAATAAKSTAAVTAGLPPQSPERRTSHAAEETAEKKVKIDPTKDLWYNITLNVKESGATESIDKTVYLVGSKGCGKSTLINRMVGSSVKSKPSTALEYRCWKKDERGTVNLGHVWELAQGEQLSSLTEVVITAENIHTVVVAICTDASDPATMWDVSTKWLKKLDRRVEDIFQKMRSKQSTTPDKLIEKAKQRVGTDHPDLSRMRLSGVPTILICNKLDQFKGDTARLKLMSRAMRFLAHLYGITLIFTSEKGEDTKKFVSLMENAVFGQRLDEDRIVNLEPERGAVIVTPARDTFRQIGDAPVTNFNDFTGTGDGELDRWKAPFDESFAAKKQSQQPSQQQVVAAEDIFLKKLYDTGPEGFGEPSVDSIRKQKDEELELYRRTAAKKGAEKKAEDGGDK